MKPWFNIFGTAPGRIVSLKTNLLLFPSLKPGNGTGHLVRCLQLAETVRSGDIETEVAVPQTGDFLDLTSFQDIQQSLNRISTTTITPGDIISSAEKYRKNTIILLDQRKSGPWVRQLINCGIPVAAVDEGGRFRNQCDYLIDTLPLPKHYSSPNIFSTGFLPLPRNRRNRMSPDSPGRILLFFGGEDRRRLGFRCIRFIRKYRLFHGYKIDIIPGSLLDCSQLPDDITILSRKERFSEELFQYDVVITTFGILSYEALAAGSVVLHFNPGGYHTRLSRIAGFPVIGTRRISPGRFRYCASRIRELKDCMPSIDEFPGHSPSASETAFSPLGAFLSSLISGNISVPRCPVCRSLRGTLLFREQTRNFYRCGNCSMEYQYRFFPSKITYSDDYFFTDYKKQYGKTYLEDFSHIKRMGLRRIREIKRLSRTGEKKTLLDVGCAYGAFLDAAREEGLNPSGIEPSPGAVSWIRENLELPVVQGGFLDPAVLEHIPEGSRNIITMWYVIEHFSYLDAVLKRVGMILTDGGLFAFSTPHGRGISRLFRKNRFFSSSPEDHYSVWNRRNAKKVLQRYGFRIHHFRVTGHHPERFPVNPGGVFEPVIGAVSRILGWGDTFEVYAVKTGVLQASPESANQNKRGSSEG